MKYALFLLLALSVLFAGCASKEDNLDNLQQPVDDINSDVTPYVPSDPLADPSEEQVNDELNAILDEIDNDSYEDDLTADDLDFE